MTQYRFALSRLLPSWLVGPVTYSLSTVLDYSRERVRLGLRARFPSGAPADALAAIGRDRKIIRGIDEPADAYAARLVRWLDDHRTRGSAYALMDQLHAYLQADVMIRTVDRRGNWFTRDADGTRSAVLAAGNWEWDTDAATDWSRFWVIIYSDAGVPWEMPTDYATHGTITATAEEVATIKRIIREWKPAGTRCEWIIVSFDASAFAPSLSPGDAGAPDSDWRYWSHSTGAGQRPVRNTDARYWAGPGNST